MRDKDIFCPECKSIMYIDEWGGWKWTCVFCDHVDRDATDEEVKQQEDEFNEARLEAKSERRKE